ncbi:hypothetical protein PM082_023380 [Marasmius tenuissimus]|nr:hypothetical protein PM082_023380 [Marasmius tenuissimus]
MSLEISEDGASRETKIWASVPPQSLRWLKQISYASGGQHRYSTFTFTSPYVRWVDRIALYRISPIIVVTSSIRRPVGLILTLF